MRGKRSSESKKRKVQEVSEGPPYENWGALGLPVAFEGEPQ